MLSLAAACALALIQAPAPLEILPPGAQARLGSSRLRHDAPIQCVAISPATGAVLSGGRDGIVRVWDAKNGRSLGLFDPQEGAIASLQVDPQGAFCAFTTAGGSLFVEPLDGKGRSRRFSDLPGRLSIAPSATTWAIGGGRTPLRWFDAADFEKPRTPEEPGMLEEPEVLEERGQITFDNFPILDFEIAPIGASGQERLAVLGINRDKQLGRGGSSDQAGAILAILALPSGDELQRFEFSTALPTSIAFGPKGERLFAARQDGTVQVWRAEDGRSEGAFPVGRRACLSLDHLVDNKFALGFEDGSVRLWDYDNPLEELGFGTSRAPVLALAGDAETIAAASGTDLFLWDPKTHQARIELQRHSGPVSGVAFAPDGTLATASYDGSVRLWSAAGVIEQRLSTPSGEWLFDVRFAPGDGALWAAGRDGSLMRWDATTYAALPILRTQSAATTALAFAEGGALAASASADGSLVLWDSASGNEVTRIDGLPGSFPRVASLPQLSALVTASALELNVWDARSGELQRTLERLPAPAESLATGPDSQIAVGLADRSVRLVDAAGEAPTRILRGHSGRVRALAFSPDGSQLASASDNETEVRLWDVASGAETGRFKQGAQVLSLAFSPDGKQLLAGAMDGNAILWRVD